jgi:hypothetical protein
MDLVNFASRRVQAGYLEDLVELLQATAKNFSSTLAMISPLSRFKSGFVVTYCIILAAFFVEDPSRGCPCSRLDCIVANAATVLGVHIVLTLVAVD